jgi:UDP-N-acetylglucosamine/UDP-N-acetylgalactosamine diphosphorylase
MGPNGNGEALFLFVQSGIFAKWRALGIEHLSLFPVDNPLAQPFNPAFIAHHIRSRAEISLAVTKKRVAEEKMGVVGVCKNKLAIVEYMELTERQRELFIYGNLAIMLFSMSFIDRVQGVSLPIHVVKKTTKKFTEEKGITFPKESNAYKFEQFIFDLLDYSNRSEAIVFDRASSFAPLKESEGPDGIESVRRALRQAELAASTN